MSYLYMLLCTIAKLKLDPSKTHVFILFISTFIYINSSKFPVQTFAFLTRETILFLKCREIYSILYTHQLIHGRYVVGKRNIF